MRAAATSMIPLDLRGRARDGRHAHRFCRRPARPDADRGGGVGGSRARGASAAPSTREHAARAPAGTVARRRDAWTCAQPSRALPSAEDLLALPRQRLDHAGARLPRALIANAHSHHGQFSRIAGPAHSPSCAREWCAVANCSRRWRKRARRAENVARSPPRDRLANSTARLAAGLRANAESHRTQIARAAGARGFARRTQANGRRGCCFVHRTTSLNRCGELLNALSHRGVLARGFALARDLAGRSAPHTPQRSIPGMAMDIEFFDGHVRALAEASSVTPADKPQSVLRKRAAAAAAAIPARAACSELSSRPGGFIGSALRLLGGILCRTNEKPRGWFPGASN